MPPKKHLGFTIVEVMIVAAIMGLLAALAIPDYIHYRRRSIQSACVANLKSLQAAIEQLKLIGDGEVSMEEVCEPLGKLKGEPRCPADKSQPYDISGPLPVCPNVGKYPDHSL